MKKLAAHILLPLALALSSTVSHADAGYIPFFASNEIGIFDTETMSVTATVKAPGSPAVNALLPDGSKLYAANFRATYVTVMDTQTLALKKVSTGGIPWCVVTSHDGKRVYAPTAGLHVAIIDTATDTVIKKVKFGFDMPIGVEVSPDDKILYVSFVSGRIGAYDAETGAVIRKPINAGGAMPAWISISPDGTKIWALNWFSDNVGVIDTAEWKVTTQIDMGKKSYPAVSTVSPDGKHLYVTNVKAGTVSVVDVAADTVVGTIDTEGTPISVTFSNDGATGFVTGSTMVFPERIDATLGVVGLFLGLVNTGSGNVTEFDVTTNVIKRIYKTAGSVPGVMKIHSKP